ncbi:MAG: DNA-binding protein [Candidatus Aenigmatarchaeota archaeon]
MNGESEELQKLQQLETIKRVVLKKILSKEATERLGRIKLVKPEIANQLEFYLVQLYQAGKISTMITDEQLKKILEQMATKQKFRILK